MLPHILVVDDEASIRDLLRELLSRSGYRVTSVGSSDEALRVLGTDPAQLVITDLQLEESDGFELTERIKAIAPELPILLVTGILFDPPTLQTMLGGRIAGYVEKTAPLSRILAEVERLIKRA